MKSEVSDARNVAQHTFHNCLTVGARPSTHASAEPRQPLQTLFDSFSLSPRAIDQMPFALLGDHFRHDQLHPTTVEVVLER